VSVLVATLASVAFGAGDFLGGLAARRIDSRQVVAIAMITGLVPFGAVVAIYESVSLDRASAPWHLLAGIGFAAGVSLLYRALSEGRMLQVAPITAVIAIAFPAIVDLMTGSAGGAHLIVGLIAATLSSVLLGSSSGTEPNRSKAGAATVLMALTAGLGFAFFYIGLHRVNAGGEGVWAVLLIRLIALAVTAIPALTVPYKALDVPGLAIAAGAGIFDGAANLLLMRAFATGGLAETAAIASLYPVTTIVLAIAILRERPSILQGLGLLLAVPAIFLLKTP